MRAAPRDSPRTFLTLTSTTFQPDSPTHTLTSARPAGMDGAWGDLSATRMSLITRLKSWDDEGGWRQFFDRYGRLLYGWAQRAGLAESDAQDAVQEIVLSVAKSLRDGKFISRGPGSFKAWLYGIARRRIADHYRRRKPGEVVTDQAADLSEPTESDLEALWTGEWLAHRLREASRLVKERVSALQFQIFDLYVLREWPVDRIKATLGVNRGRIYMAKLRVAPVFRAALSEIDAAEAGGTGEA